VNIDERYGFDLNFNIENKFPLQDNEFDNVLAINLIEHIMDTNNVFSETARVLKPGGQFVATIPFMHHIHGSPDDFVRLTKSAYEKLASKYGFEIIYMEELGGGLFSFIFQSLIIRNWWRLDVIFNIAKFLFVTMDNILHIIPGYGGFAKLIPLGYFFIMKKK
jgi:SAM-dependent methyltransferase